MAGFCEHGTEPSDSIKDGLIFDQLSSPIQWVHGALSMEVK
jgi:hypothetical protein